MPDLDEELREKQEAFVRLLGYSVSLRSFRGVLIRIVQLISDPNSSAQDLADVVSTAPAIATRILGVVNSPYYGLTHEVTSLGHAIALMGFEELKKIALSVSIFDTFTSGERVYLAKLWRHSILCGIVSRILGEQLRCSPDEVFAGGLLHDVGKVLLCNFNPKAFRMALFNYQYESSRLSHHEVESRLLGINHAEIGAIAGKGWNLPGLMVEVIHKHHQKYPELPVIQIIQLANALCTNLGFPSVGPDKAVFSSRITEVVDKSLYSVLGLSKEDLELLWTPLDAGIRQAMEFFALFARE
ncbi:MAG: HDOD domain-containing protein [Armatimonadetes bacterium]|nr:HDOD domain-containing protein [Armatimonadota bacterium]